MTIYIDCSYIDFNRQPTGIPRVVLQYIECGYRWAAQSGVDVIPVVTSATGLVVVRPVPGSRVPPYLAQFETKGHEGSANAAPMLEMAAYNLQSALVHSGYKPNAQDCLSAVNSAFSTILERFSYPVVTIKEGDILFCPAYWHDVKPEYFRSLQRNGVRVVTLVHDVLPITHSRFYQAPWKYEFEHNLLEHLKHSDAILAVSQYTADSITEIAERKNIAGVHVELAQNAYFPLVSDKTREKIVNGQFRSLTKSNTKMEIFKDSNPFIMVGTIEPKKGHIPTIRSFEALWNAGLERPLFIAGRKGWLEESVVHAIEKSKYYNDKLFWSDDMDDLDLFYAYHHSRGLIFSSYAEGFGIPMVEALSAGRPVIAYDTPINAEVLGTHGLMFSNFKQFVEHVLRLDSDEGFNEACAAVAGFRWPSWDEMVPRVFDRLVARFSPASARISL